MDHEQEVKTKLSSMEKLNGTSFHWGSFIVMKLNHLSFVIYDQRVEMKTISLEKRNDTSFKFKKTARNYAHKNKGFTLYDCDEEIMKMVH